MTYTSLIARSLNPLVYLTIGASVVSGAWLLMYVPLSIVWMPVLLLIFGHMVFPFLLLPVQIIMALLSRRPALAQLSCFAWLAALLALTAVLIFAVTRRAEAPALLLQVFSVGAAVSPWAAFCLKDRGNLMFIALVWIFLLAVAVAAAVHAAFGLGTLAYGLFVWGGVMAGLGAQAVFEARINRPRA